MEVLTLQIFVSLVLVLVSLLLFAHAAKGKAHEQADRLSLLPLADDEGAPTVTHSVTQPRHKEPGGAHATGDQRCNRPGSDVGGRRCGRCRDRYSAAAQASGSSSSIFAAG